MVESSLNFASRLRAPAILSLMLGLVVGLLVVVPVALAQTPNPTGPGIKISEFQTRGTAGGNDDFVEIRNTSGASIDISGFKLQGCSGSSGDPSDRVTVPAGTTLAANQTYLFANTGFDGGVTPDQTFSSGITDFLSDNASGARIVDASNVVQDGVGSAGTTSGGATSDCREGTGLLTSTQNQDVSFERQPPDNTDPDAPGVNATDTNNNSSDFATNTPSNPQNSDGESGGVVEQPGDTEISEIQGAQQRSPLVPAGEDESEEEVENVEGVITAFRDFGFFMQDDTPDTDPETSDGIFVFTGGNTPPENTLAIGDRVLVDGTVSEFRAGCGDDENADGDPCEPDDGGFDNLSETQIESTLASISDGTPPTGVITPTIIGTGGRVPPTGTIEDDTNGDVEDSGDNDFDPEEDGIDFFESLEGMLIQVNNAVAVGPTDVPQVGGTPFGEIPVLADGGTASADSRTTRGGVEIDENDFNPERIIFDDEVLKDTEEEPLQNQVDVGDTFDTPLTGVISYSFGSFKAELTERPMDNDTSPERETTRLRANNNEISVAEYSLENLSPEEDETTFEGAATEIVNNLDSPDILGLTEIQDNDGDTDSDITDASGTAQELITAIATAGGPTYQYREVDPLDDQDGGEPGGNIRVGFLFQEDNGLQFVDRGDAGPTDATKVKKKAKKGKKSKRSEAEINLSPGRIQPNNPAFLDSRKPLVGEFRFNGKPLFVIQNHFNSKSEDSPLFGRFQPPLLRSEDQRNAQAQVVNDFVDQILKVNNKANVIVMGDLNDFEFSRPLEALEEGRGLRNLINSVPDDDRYTFVFEGNSQVLDHMLVSRSLRDANDGDPDDFDIVHASAEFADRRSDHDPLIGFFEIKKGKKKGGNR